MSLQCRSSIKITYLIVHVRKFTPAENSCPELKSGQQERRRLLTGTYGSPLLVAKAIGGEMIEEEKLTA